MLKDGHYTDISNEKYLSHNYSKNVFLINSIRANSLLAKFGDPKTVQPVLSHLTKSLYLELFEQTMNLFAPRSLNLIKSRMAEVNPKGAFQAEVIDREKKLVVVDLARAGTLPSEICFLEAHFLFRAKNIRQDHFYINRETNNKGEVIGVNNSGSKIGGDIQDALVLFPDPMGATGSSIEYVYQHYLNTVPGKASEMVAMHLVVTPEYIKKITKTCPKLKIVALRLDRGLSSEKVLKSGLGEFIDEEKGLNEYHYIVPGLGGVGEILNNSYC